MTDYVWQNAMRILEAADVYKPECIEWHFGGMQTFGLEPIIIIRCVALPKNVGSGAIWIINGVSRPNTREVVEMLFRGLLAPKTMCELQEQINNVAKVEYNKLKSVKNEVGIAHYEGRLIGLNIIFRKLRNLGYEPEEE